MTTKKTQKPEVDPILYEAPTVTIAGNEYSVRRLDTRDVFKVARILGRGVSMLADPDSLQHPSQVLQVLIASMTVNEDEVQKLLASLVGVPLKDWESFPPTAVVDVLEILSQHQDLQDFLARVQRLTEMLPEMQTPSRKS